MEGYNGVNAVSLYKLVKRPSFAHPDLNGTTHNIVSDESSVSLTLRVQRLGPMLSRSIGWKPNAHTGLPLPGVGTSAPPSLGTADHSSIGSTRRLPESWPSARHSSQLGACCQTTTTPSVSFSPQCNIHRVAPSHLRRRDARVSKPQRRDIPTDFPVYIAREVGEAVIVPSVRQLRSQSNASRTFYQEAPHGVWRAELSHSNTTLFSTDLPLLRDDDDVLGEIEAV